MDQESCNWFRYAKLLINTGSEVLRTLFNLEIQTSCFSSYRTFWFERVQESDPANFIAVWWTKWNVHLTRLDRDSQKIFKDLYSLKPKDTTKLPLLQQIHEIGKWHNFIQSRIPSLSSTSERSKMSDLANNMNNDIQKMNALYKIQSNWTRRFIELVNKYCIGLRDKLEKYHDARDDFILTCQNNLCKLQDPLKTNITNFLKASQYNVQNMQKNWSQESQEYFNFWKEEIAILLDSFKKEKHNIDFKDALQKLLDSVSKDLPVEHFRRMAELERIHGSWNDDVQKMLDKWQVVFNVHVNNSLDFGIFISSWNTELSAQQCSESYQLRKFFHSDYVQSEISRLRDHEILKDHQFTKLSSTQDVPDINEFDITLMIILLRNICHVCPPDLGWCDQILQLDLSVGADLMRLRTCRNEYIGHIAKASIPAKTFDELWTTLQFVLCRLASYCGSRFQAKIIEDIKTLKICHLEPQQELRFKSEVIIFCKNAILVDISEISLSGSMEEVARFRDMYQSVRIAEKAFYQNNTIEAIQPQIRDGLNKLSTMKKEIKVLEEHKKDIETNRNFTYVSEELQQRKVDAKPNRFVTNCFVCYSVCHDDCSIPDDSGKKDCVAMKNDYCTKCVGKCHWTEHKNRRFYFETYVEKKEKTYESLKAKYASTGDEKKKQPSVEEKIKSHIESEGRNVMSMIKVVRKSVNNSEERTHRTNDAKHLDLMIGNERTGMTVGWTDRVQILQEIKKKVLSTKKKPDSDYLPNICVIS